MPKIGQNNGLRGALPPCPLTVPQLHVLRELECGDGLRSGTIADRAGGAQSLAGLESLGYVIVERIDLDGATERVWQITDTGRAALNGAARPARGGKMRADGGNGLTLGALVPWFGSARRVAAMVGEACRGRAWVGVPFCGSLAEVPAILEAGVWAVAVNDVHRHLINLMRVAACLVDGPRLWKRLRRQPFTEAVLRDARTFCMSRGPGEANDLEAAFAYFISAWMGRSGNAGTGGEFNGGLAMRWSASGGDSALRFARATFSLKGWRAILGRCTITCLDAFEFLAKVADHPKGCVYADPPWPERRDAYACRFSEADQRRLAKMLAGFHKVRVVVRSGGGLLMEELYPRSLWRWLKVNSRSQTNAVSSEWLMICDNV